MVQPDSQQMTVQYGAEKVHEHRHALVIYTVAFHLAGLTFWRRIFFFKF